jgi:trehalose-phosphatase
MSRDSILQDTSFWERVQLAPMRFLGLDYDGTLAPFQVERMAAVPSPGVVEAIQRIRAAQQTRIVVISGRLLHEVKQLLGELAVTIVGSHGYEIQPAGGPISRLALQPEQERGLAEAKLQLEGQGLGERLERKASSLAFHTRGLPPDEASRLEQRAETIFSRFAEAEGLDCRHFDGGLELRAIGVDKGTVLEGLLDQHPRETFCVYLGDDLTDEDAFDVIEQRGGIGIKVGSWSLEQTRASAWLPGCPEVVEFLQRWAEL